MYKVAKTQNTNTNKAKSVLSSTGLRAISRVRRPLNKDLSFKNSILFNTKNSSEKVEVSDSTNKTSDVTSKNDDSNKKIATNDDIKNTLIAKNVLCVTFDKNVLISCHDDCLAKYKLNVHSKVRRAIVTTSRTAKSKFKDPTPVVSKTMFSIQAVQSKSLDTTSVVLKTKIVAVTPLSAKYKASMVQIVLWIVDSGCSKHMTSDRSLLKNFVEKLMGTVRFVLDNSDGDLEVVFHSKMYYVQNLERDDLLTGDRESNLYIISIFDMAASSPVCLMSKATSIKSWLWHRRLSHLNFGTINDLTKYDLVDGLPKFKYGKDHLCSACERGKSKKASHPPNLAPNETPVIIKNFIARVQLNYNAKVCKIHIDNGTEFKNAILKAHYDKLDSIIPLGQKNTLAEYMILSGVDNRPPMLDKDLYDSWKSRMELYMQNREHEIMILESVENGPLIWPTIEDNGVTRTKKYAELSAAEKIQADCDMKATNIILQGLPADIYSLVNHHRVAEDLWVRVQLLMQGTSLTKQERECKLYDAFDKFTHIKRESLHKYYLRFTQLINDMNIYNMKMEQFQVNTKFLNSLPPDRSKFVTNVKLVKDLHTTNFDQLHAYLEQHEFYANEVRLLHERNQDPLALLQQQFPPSQYGSIHPTQHYSSTYPSQPQFNHSSIPPSYPYQSQMNLQTSSIPQIAYQSPQVSTQPMTESPLVDSGLAVLVFSPRDDPIACLNKAMAFLTAVASSRVIVQQVQGRQGQSYSGTGYKSNATSLGGNNASGQASVVKCYNCQDPGVPDGQAVQSIIQNNADFLTEDLDTYDSDCDDISNTKSVLMANITNYGSDVISEAQQDLMILSMIEQMSEQMINHVNNWEKANKEQNNESVTTELERYKERVKTFKQRLNIDLSSREKMIDSQMDDMIKEKLALKEQVDSLEQNLSKQIKEKESLLQTFTVFKNESKEKENKYMENEIDLEKKIKELDNIILKVGQSAHIVHIKLVISAKHVAMPVIDDEETLILEEESRSKMFEKEKDPKAIKQNISHKPIDYEKLKRLSEDFGKCFTPQQELVAEQAFWFCISNPTIESSNKPPVKVEVPSELPKVSLVNASLKKLKFHLAQLDSVVKKKITPDARTEGEWGFKHTKAIFNNEIIPFLKSLKDIFNVFDKDLLNEIMEVQTVFDQMEAAVQQSSVDKQCLEIAKKELLLENDRLLQQIMSPDVLLTMMNSMSLNGESVNMEMQRNESCDKCFNLDAELSKSQHAYNDLLKSYSQLEKHSQIQDKVFVITSLKNDLQKVKGKEIVDIAAQIPSANTIVPGMFKLDLDPLAPRLLQNREALIDYLKYTQEQVDILRGIVESSKTSYSNTPVLSPTGLKCSTSNYGSKPIGNKKNDRISQTPSRNMKNKVEFQPRKVNKKNLVIEPIRDVDVKHSLLNENSEPICATCKKSMFDGVHDMYLLNFVENVNSHAKSAKKHKKQNIWKPTGHVFTKVGLKWKPAGITFTIVGNSCPLTRITSANVVPPKKTISHSVKTQKPELKVYSRKPKNVKNAGLSKKAKIAVQIVLWTIGYGDYKLGNVTISRVYYVEGLRHNLFSVGQFCDADLEVAFRKNTCFLRNLEGVDLLFGSRDINLYIISLDDMLKKSLICLLSKASTTKSWLWHHRLSHLNFGTLNKLSKDGLARGIPRLKF
ncbi:integrase, catalytic region, zinc finger, CCHC-type containing protein [Tanacetum coccineum]